MIVDTQNLPQMLRRFKPLRIATRLRLRFVLHYAKQTPYRLSFPMRASLSYYTLPDAGGALVCSQVLTWVGFRRDLNHALLVIPDAQRTVNGQTFDTCDAKVSPRQHGVLREYCSRPMMYGPFRRLQGDAYDWSVPFDEFPRPPPISLNLADEPEQPEIGQVRARV